MALHTSLTNQKKMNSTKIPPRTNTIVYTVKEPTILFSFLEQIKVRRSRTALKSLLTHRQVVVNGIVVTEYRHPLLRGDRVGISAQGAEAPNPNHKISFVYEDKNIIAVDKKTGTSDGFAAGNGTRSALVIALEHTKRQRTAQNLFFVHHLERDVSGVLLFAKTEEVQAQLAADKDKNLFKRTFVAVVEGKLQPKNGQLTHWLKQSEKQTKTTVSTTDNDGKEAKIDYKTLKSNDRFSLVEVTTNDDFRQQIRAQLAAAGTPVAGDKKYGATTNPLKRICLHATEITYYHPETGKKSTVKSPIPKEFF